MLRSKRLTVDPKHSRSRDRLLGGYHPFECCQKATGDSDSATTLTAKATAEWAQRKPSTTFDRRPNLSSVARIRSADCRNRRFFEQGEPRRTLESGVIAGYDSDLGQIGVIEGWQLSRGLAIRANLAELSPFGA